MQNPLIIFLILAGIALIAFAVLVFFRKRKAASNDCISGDTALVSPSKVEGELVEIPITYLPASTAPNENCLAEITDRTVISRISALVPTISQTATRQVANNAGKALQGAELVKLDIPFSKLTQSKEVAGAARGYVHGSRGVAAQANLTKVDLEKVTKATNLANGVANVMNVGSLVVGQYYMTEINDKLEKMNDSINKVGDFQNREFKSRIISLISRVKKYSGFSSEIIENDETRIRILSILEGLEGDATELLGQVNIEVCDIVTKNPSPSYQEYQNKVDEFNILVEYQNTLITVLAEISKLIYLLGKGTVSRDMSLSVYNDYLTQTVATRNQLEQWHDKQVESLKIDLDKNRKSKNWFAALPGIVNDKWKYQPLAQGMAEKIGNQSQAESLSLPQAKEIFEEDVEIIIKDGKYYYMHDNDQEMINN
ncbi:topoisomerase IV [Ruminococcaceae bacterium OttesenSCG-928-D13]|nr:topoisomerase IV [Ruminococcaceae bacterium OttesenSCG-928-D13]